MRALGRQHERSATLRRLLVHRGTGLHQDGHHVGVAALGREHKCVHPFVVLLVNLYRWGAEQQTADLHVAFLRRSHQSGRALEVGDVGLAVAAQEIADGLPMTKVRRLNESRASAPV